MALEIELKLSLPPEQVSALLAHPLLGKPQRRVRMVSTYFDTPDLDLLGQHVGVRLRSEGKTQLQAIKTAEAAQGGLVQRREWESAAPAAGFDFAIVDDPQLRGILLARQAALQPIFTTRFTRWAWQLHYGDSLIELALDRGWTICGRRREPICEVELELVHGQLADVFALALALQTGIALYPATGNKAERGYSLLRPTPPKVRKAHPVALDVRLDAVDAFRRIALECLAQWQENVSGLTATGQPEFVHQGRVALRRLRSALRAFAPVLPADFVSAAHAGWRVLAGEFGQARDWDVFLADTAPRLQAARFLSPAALAQAGRARSAAHARLAALLGTAEYRRWLLQFAASLWALGDSGQTLGRLVRHSVRRQWRATLRDCQALAALDDARRHRLRLRFKRLRYTLDFFAPVLAERWVKPLASALVDVQGALGVYNDQVTAERLLAELAAGRPPTAALRAWALQRRRQLWEAAVAVLAQWAERQLQSGFPGNAPSRAEFR